MLRRLRTERSETVFASKNVRTEVPVGATSGSISYTLYHVESPPESDYRLEFLDKIEEFAFRALTPESEDEESLGWVELGELLQQSFDRDSVFRDQYLCLSMRIDRWSLPAALFRAVYDERAREMADKRGKPKLSRTEADALKDVLRREFKGKSLPSAAMIDMVWNLETNRLRFWSHANKSNEYFQELFESTFSLRLHAQSPYIAARGLDLEPEEIGRLSDVSQDSFGADGGF